MALGIGSAVASIGDILRATCEQQGMTLDQVSELSGISKSALSRLESGDRQPSVASLLGLSATFGVSVGALFGETEQAAPLAISRPDEARRETNGLMIGPCSGYAGSSVMDALRVTIRADRPTPALTRHPGEEWIYVLGGTLRLEYDGEIHLLGEGNAAHFNAELSHRLGADQSTAELLLVAAKPTRNLHQIH